MHITRANNASNYMAIVMSSGDLRAFRCTRRNREQFRQSTGPASGYRGDKIIPEKHEKKGLTGSDERAEMRARGCHCRQLLQLSIEHLHINASMHHLQSSASLVRLTKPDQNLRRFKETPTSSPRRPKNTCRSRKIRSVQSRA